jgi:hypothetical protein
MTSQRGTNTVRPDPLSASRRTHCFQVAGNLDAAIDRLVPAGVTESEDQRGGEIGQERERMRGVDDERG